MVKMSVEVGYITATLDLTSIATAVISLTFVTLVIYQLVKMMKP